MVNKGRSLPGVDSFVGDIGAFAGPLILLVLSLLLLVVPAEAQPAFGMSDLAGIWRLHILTGSAAVDVPGSTLRGTIELDATGALVTGALDHADGSTTSLAGGTFTISSLGLVLGSLSAADLGDAEITEARMLFDRQVILGVISGGDPGTIAGADYGLVTLVKVSAGFADDLVATWRYHELRTSDTAGQPPTSVVGEAVFDTATIAGGALITPDSLSGTPAGVQLTTADGGFTASVSGVGAAWQVTGQVAASADFIAGTTKVGGGAAAGLALASRVGGGASVATSHLAGAWTIYVVALDGAHGNHGTFLRGALLIDAGGGLVSGTIADAPDGAELTLNSGLLAVDSTTARVTGTLTAATAQTFALDATLRGSADLVSGLLTVGGTAPAALGLLVMVRDVSLVGFDAATYRVAEGGAATVTIVRSGDVTQASTLSLRAHGARFGDQVLALTFSAGATTRSVSIPTVEDGIFGVETVTLELTGLPAGVLLGPLGTATLTIADDEEAGSFRFGAPAYQVLEGNPVTVTVQRAGPKLGGGATVSWAVVGGTATPGADFEPSSGTLTFDPGVTQRTLIISTARDRLAEGNETIVLGLSGARLDVPSTTRIVIQDDDVGGTIQLAPGPLRVFENAGPALVTVTRSGGTAEAVTVDYEASGLTARPGVDFTAVFGTLTFAADVTSLTFAVPLVDTTLAEGDRTVRLVLRNPGGGATLGALRETVLTILDDEVGVRFDAPAYTVAENAGGITITVLRTGPTTGVSTVNYSTSDGTAQAGADYTATAGRLTFQPGDKSKTFRVPILEDQIVEDIETIVVVLSNPTGAVLGPVNAAVVAITDNDKGGVVQFATPTLSVSESQPNATLQVTRTGGMATAVKVDYLATDGSARSGQDYAETSGTLTFAAGERSKTILVPLLSDRRVEPNETFTVTLSNPTGGATLGTPAQVVVTINSSDAGGVIRFSSASYRVDEPNSLGTPVTITVTRSGTNLAGGVSVQYATSDGTAVAPADYFASAGQLVFGPGETVKTFEIVVRGDGALESDETVTITLSDPQGGARLGTPSVATLTIVDSGTSVRFERSEYVVEERAGAVTLAVVRSGPSGDTLKVGYATADIPDGEPPAGHAVAGTHYRATSGTLTFRPGDSRKPLSVPIVLDPAAGNPKAFRVLLTPPSGLSQDLDRTALVTILDSARPGVVQFASAASTVREGASVAIAVTRSEGLDGTVVVSWSATGGTATAGADFTPASGVLTFSPGASSRTITIAAVNDTLAEGDETVTLQLSGVTGNASLGPRATHTLTIQDDDTAGTIELSAPSYSAAEGASAVITVVRRGGLASGVTVDFTTEDMGVGPGVAVENSDYAKITRTLTFGAKETTKTVSIALTPDAEPESDETFRVRLSNPQPALATLGPQTTAVVTIQDRQSRLAFRDPVVRVTEGQSATITVTRTGPLLGQVTVGYRAAGGSAVEEHRLQPASGHADVPAQHGEHALHHRNDWQRRGRRNADRRAAALRCGRRLARTRHCGAADRRRRAARRHPVRPARLHHRRGWCGRDRAGAHRRRCRLRDGPVRGRRRLGDWWWRRLHARSGHAHFRAGGHDRHAPGPDGRRPPARGHRARDPAPHRGDRRSDAGPRRHGDPVHRGPRADGGVFERQLHGGRDGGGRRDHRRPRRSAERNADSDGPHRRGDRARSRGARARLPADDNAVDVRAGRDRQDVPRPDPGHRAGPLRQPDGPAGSGGRSRPDRHAVRGDPDDPRFPAGPDRADRGSALLGAQRQARERAAVRPQHRARGLAALPGRDLSVVRRQDDGGGAARRRGGAALGECPGAAARGDGADRLDDRYRRSAKGRQLLRLGDRRLRPPRERKRRDQQREGQLDRVAAHLPELRQADVGDRFAVAGGRGGLTPHTGCPACRCGQQL